MRHNVPCNGHWNTLVEPVLQSWLLQKPQGADVSPAARTLAANLQQIRWAISNQGPTSAMKNPMSNVVFGMAAANLSTFK
jgi:hypothetical protein